MSSVFEDMELPTLCRVAARVALRDCGVAGSTLDVHDVEDISQETYLRLLASRSVVVPRQAVWKTAKRVVIDILRKVQPTFRIDLDGLPASARRDDDKAGARAIKDRLDSVMRALSPSERRVADYCLRTGEDLTNSAAIAAGLNAKPNTISVGAGRLRRRARSLAPGVEELEGR